MAESRRAPAPGHGRPQTDAENVWRAHASHYTAITSGQIIVSTSDASCRDTYVYLKLFRQVVCGRQSEHADGLAPASEELWNERNDKNKKPKPKKGTGAELRGAAGFSDVHDPNASLFSALLTGGNRAMPYARFGGADYELALFRRVYRVLTN